MDSKIDSFLTSWSTTSFFSEKRSYKVQENPVLLGEFRISLKMEIDRIVELPKHIFSEHHLYTFAQSKADFYKNPDGDLYRLEEAAKDLEKKFFEKLDQEIDTALQELNPDGFF